MGEFTYEYLFDVVRRERSRDEIQELDDDFFDRARAYLEDLATKARAEDPLSHNGDQVRLQAQNARKLLRELYDRREKKIMLLALNTARTGARQEAPLLTFENTLFKDVLKQLEDSRGRTLGKLASTPPPQSKPKRSPIPQKTTSPQPSSDVKVEKPASGSVNLKFIASVPKFMGSQKETFGPFEKGTEAALPERIAQILIKKGRAEEA